MRRLISIVGNWRRQGTRHFLRHNYRTKAREHLPETSHISHSDVLIARRRRLFDVFLPEEFHRSADDPDREGGVVSAHGSSTRTDDDVVIVGGGSGVTAVRAARIVGPGGSVRVFEGADENVRRIRRAFELNGVADRCTVERAVVGPSRDVWGDAASVPRVAPTDLPACDVLELDCEGAELEILRNVEFVPRVAIVELHPWLFDGDAGAVEELLSGMGHSVRNRYGHDGVVVTDEAEFEFLLQQSARDGDRYGASGARWPLVIETNGDTNAADTG